MGNKRILLAMAFVLLATFTGGCAQDNPTAPPSTAQTEPTKGEQQAAVVPPGSQNNVSSPVGQDTMSVTVYSATKDAMFLVAEHYVVPKNAHPAQTAIELLLAGTKNTQLESVMPAGTKLRHISIKDKVAYVDFSDQLVKNNAGGSTSEMLLVGAVVNTLTEFHDIQKVQIMVEGKKIDTISGHMDISEPLGRSEKIIKK